MRLHRGWSDTAGGGWEVRGVLLFGVIRNLDYRGTTYPEIKNVFKIINF